MFLVRWIYNRIGQMICFGYGAAALAFSGSADSVASALGGGFLLLAGVGLKAVFHWRQQDDPELV